MKKHLLASSVLVAGSLLAFGAQAAEAEMYGQVNKALIWADNGDESRVQVGDNNVSSTRFGFRGEQAVGNGLSASFLIEGELSDSDSSRGTLGLVNEGTASTHDAASAGASTFTERHARVGLSGGFGSVFLGRTSSATDGITEIDLGSATDIMTSDAAAIGGGMDLDNDAAAGADNIVSFDGAYDNIEGFASGNGAGDRPNLVRYDTPIYNGFQGSVALANGGDADLAVRYGAKFGATEVKAGLGWAQVNSDANGGAGATTDQWSGSVSAKHDSGLNGTFAYGERDVEGSNLDRQFMYAKVGYDMGKWGFAADWANADEMAVADQEADSFGLGAQYNFGNGVSAGLLYRTFEIDGGATPATVDEGSVAAATLRVKF